MNHMARPSTENGARVESNRRSQTAGPNAPVLVPDHHPIKKLAISIVSELPSVWHMRGSGEFGSFKVNADAWR